MTRDEMIALPLEELEREWREADRYPSIAASVADAMANTDAVSGKGCKALPFLIDDPDDSVSWCDVDGACDRHRSAELIGPRLRRLRARSRS
jgi:hypothetical protein